MDHSLPRGDGYSIRAKYLLEAQAAQGHQVSVVTSPSQGLDAIDESIAGVSYHRTQYSSLERSIVRRGGKNIVFGQAIRRGLVELLDRGGIDVIHGHTPFTVAGVGLREARRRGLPFVYEKRNLWEESARARGKMSGRWPFYQVAKAIDRRVTVAADGVCTITEALKAHTVGLGADPDRVFVVGNGVDTDAFTPRMPAPELRARCADGGDLVLGFVGSFFSFEGLPLLVEACARLRQDYPGLRLVLVGEGEDTAKLEQLVERLDLGRNVLLTGRVPHSQVLDYYAAMDVLIYPRYPSPLTQMISPLKPLEPMAMSRCVVASDVGGLRELIRDRETGLLFEAGSLTGLVATLGRILSGGVDTMALGRAAREFVIAKRQWRHMAAVYESAYKRAHEAAKAA